MTEKPTRMNLGSDPLDPHGDGTIRQGDPLYDLLMSGVVHAERVGDSDEWNVATTTAPEAPPEPPTPLPWWRKVLARIGGRR